MPASEQRLAACADENLAVHFSWAQRQTRGMRVADNPDLLLTDCGMPCDTFNAACRARLSPGNALDRIRETLAWFGERQHPFSWWVGPGDSPSDLGHLLLGAGLEPAGGELAMAAELRCLNVPDQVPAGLQIRRVTSPSELAEFARINAANWSPPDRHVLRFYELGARALLASESPLWYYLGYVDGAAIATAELTVAGGVVGLYNICTLASHRRRGYGTAMTVRPLLDAAAAGHGTAILQAAPDGVGVYRRVGFRTFGEITEYKPVA